MSATPPRRFETLYHSQFLVPRTGTLRAARAPRPNDFRIPDYLSFPSSRRRPFHPGRPHDQGSCATIGWNSVGRATRSTVRLGPRSILPLAKGRGSRRKSRGTVDRAPVERKVRATRTCAVACRLPCKGLYSALEIRHGPGGTTGPGASWPMMTHGETRRSGLGGRE
jgi:hypothetical protein